MGIPAAVSEWCAQLRLVQGSGIRVIAHASADVSDDEVAAFAAEALQLGYIAIDAHRSLADDRRRTYWHRHVALIHRGAATPESVRWIRELAHASPRAHVVIAIPAQPDRVHEGAGAHMSRLDEFSPSVSRGGLAARAGRYWGRRRAASARRWAGAAVEQARRSRDESGAAHAFAQLARYSHGDDAALIARGRRLLLDLEQLAPRSRVTAVIAGAWIAAGDFEAATAALAAVEVECMLSGVAVPPWIRRPQCELAGWQGRWDDVDNWARESALLEWRAVAAFAKRDWGTVRMLASAVTPEDADCAEWPDLLAAMAYGAAGDRAGLAPLVQRARRQNGPPRWRDVLLLESLRMAGAEDEARAWIAECASKPRGPVEHLLWQWATSGSGGQRVTLDARIRQHRADGVRRWGLGRQDMQIWAGVSSLLQQVHEADDAAAAMRRGCSWAREYTGVDAVGIVAADGTLMTCQPESRRQADSTPGVVQEVRYGGIRIGEVVMRGAPRDASEARAVALALATACAPALRARLDDLLVSRAGATLASDLLGISPAIQALRDAVARAAGSSFPVLIEGESGTGKELVARAVHRLSARRDRRWAAVNCAALTDELLEAELFGHVRGAFTGAIGARLGLLEDAHEGTLFLDEVAELSSRAQAKLLRVLQEGEIRRVGENTSRRVDVRLIAATNRSLAEAVGQGVYREDLLFRLAVIRLRVPPLRDRVEDVPVLAQAFWRNAATRVSTRALLAPDAIAALCRFQWPGNVRELQNVIAALAVGGPSRGRIGARQVAAILAERSSMEAGELPVSLAAARRNCDRRVVAASLARHANQRAAAARELGVSRQGLAKLIARLNLNETHTISNNQL